MRRASARFTFQRPRPSPQGRRAIIEMSRRSSPCGYEAPRPILAGAPEYLAATAPSAAAAADCAQSPFAETWIRPGPAGDGPPHWSSRRCRDEPCGNAVRWSAHGAVERHEPVGASAGSAPRRQARACFEPMETVSRFRPFLRRRDKTARPQRSAMRKRNPCLAIRRLFRGRYVGIIAVHSFQ